MKKKIVIYILIILVVILAGIVYCKRIINLIDENNVQMPKIYITGNLYEMIDKSDKREVLVKYESNDVNFESYALIKVQGEYTLNFDKKNYNITFYEDQTFEKKQAFDVKWGEFNKYTLKANWTDPLHWRNVVTAQIAAEMNKKYDILTDSPNYGLTDGFPIEVYLNDEFHGIYTMNLHKDSLFKMDKKNENNLAIFAEGASRNYFTKLETERWGTYEVEIGDENQETLDKLNRMIGFVINSTDEEFVSNFEEYFNLDSVLNYYCYMKFAHLIDNVVRNIFFVTYDGKVWYMVPYDFDQSWGNEFPGRSLIKDLENKHTQYSVEDSKLWSRFEKLFFDKICDRYKVLREEILTKEHILSKIKEFNSLLNAKTQEKEDEKWNNKPVYEKSYINNYIDNQIEFFDKKYELSK